MTRFTLDEPAAREWLALVIKENESIPRSTFPMEAFYDGWRAIDNGDLWITKAIISGAQERNLLTHAAGATMTFFFEHTGPASVYDPCFFSVRVPFGDQDEFVMLTSDELIYTTFVKPGLFGIDQALHVLHAAVAGANAVLDNMDAFIAAR